jgi:hypothetical protein
VASKHVTRMQYMFYQAAALNQPIGGGGGSATDIGYMFVLQTRVLQPALDSWQLRYAYAGPNLHGVFV